MKKRNLPVIAAAVVALVVLALLNRAASNTTQNAASQQPTPPAPTSAQSSKTAEADSGGSQPLITEATIGNVATAKVHATLGYTVDTYIASHTDQADQIIKQFEAWANSNHFSSAQVVCLDIPPGLRKDPSTAHVPLGLSIDGKIVPGLATDIGPSMQWRGGMDEELYSRTGSMQFKQEQAHLAAMKHPS